MGIVEWFAIVLLTTVGGGTALVFKQDASTEAEACIVCVSLKSKATLQTGESPQDETDYQPDPQVPSPAELPHSIQ